MSIVNSQPAWFKPPCLSTAQESHAVVIGGGLAGAQIAWHLAEQGWKITLLERHAQLACEASGNKAGVLSPKMTAEASLGESFYHACFEYAIQQLQLLEQQKIGLSWQQCGVLQLNHNAREQRRWQALKQRSFADNFLQCLTAPQASKIAGIPINMGASYFPQGGWVDPRSLVTALCTHPNITIQLHTEALELQRDPLDQTAWLISNTKRKTLLTTKTVVIANGKDAAQFKVSRTPYLPFTTVLGQSSQASSTVKSQKLKVVIGHTGYLTPAIGMEQQHIFGATFQRNQNNTDLQLSADQYNRQQLQQHLPEFNAQLDTVCSSHAAIRMTTADRFPYVGALPDSEYYQREYADIHYGKHWKNYPNAHYQQGLFIFAGHASRGITTIGLSAKYLSSLITAQPFTAFSDNIKYALHPARFLIRQLKRGKR